MFSQDDEKTQPWFYDIKDFAAKFRLKLLAGKKQCCPTCGRWNQLYSRPLNSSMCRQLIVMYQRSRDPEYMTEDGWVHVSQVVLKGTSGPGDFSKLKHWALVEAAEHVEGATKSSGYWRLTGAGVKFVTGQIALHQVAVLLNDELIRYDGDKAKIHTALGTKFNYLEIMGGSNGKSKKRAG